MATEREKERFTFERPEFTLVEFRIDRAPNRYEVWKLNLLDSSREGLAILVTPDDFDLLNVINEGDILKDLSFFGVGAQIKSNGIVRHITAIREGRFKGCYSLGVEARDI
jgi:hypothetical protein